MFISTIVNFLIAIGVFAVLKPVFNILVSLWHHYRKSDDLPKRYGKGTWALVTGATDGIGFGFCQELAMQGFNICLVSRSEKKLQEKAGELKKTINSNVQYKYVVADFTKSGN